MESASSAAATQLTQPHHHHRADRQREPKPSASPGAMRPGGIGRLRVRSISASMSRVVPHVDGARRAGADGDAQHRGEAPAPDADARRQQQADERR
jgi:hypothetical protein